MDKCELYLKTIFCCMCCDGNIAAEEIDVIKNVVAGNTDFIGFDIEARLAAYVSDVNCDGFSFQQNYLKELSSMDLSDEEQLKLIGFALRTIDADSKVEYAEVKFFKKIRTRLSVSDAQILARYPEREDFLLPDIKSDDMDIWNNLSLPDITLI